MTDYTELKRLVDRVLTDRRFCGDENHKALADGVRALIAENDRLESERAELWRGKRDVEATRDTKSAVIAELKAEIAGLKTGYEAYERVNAELKAECEALRKDAGRWQFVRNPVGSGSPFANWSERTNLFLGKFADEAIDTAMGKGEQS